MDVITRTDSALLLSGILRESIVLSPGSTVRLTSNLQVAKSVTVTVEAGATIDLAGFEILNFGTVTLNGDDSNFAVLRNGTYSTDSTSGALVTDFGELNGVTIDSFFTDGSLTLSNTLIHDSQINALALNSIVDSAFVDSSFDVGIESADVETTTFFNSLVSIDAWNSYFGGASTFTDVNFVNSDQAIYLDPFFSGSDKTHRVDISNSYINTDNPDLKIYDSDDDLRISKNITANSFLQTPITNSSDGFSVGSYTISLDHLNIGSLDTDSLDSVSIPDGVVESEAPLNLAQYSLKVIANVFGSIMFLDGLTEIVTSSSHTIEYNGTTFDYAEVDGIITTVVRDGEFTSEFAAEIAESFPDSAGISYSTAVALIGQANIESTLLMVAGADGNYVG